jgi:ChrB-like protein
MTDSPDRPGEWVLLSYRLPREPSGPRTAVWRKLRKLGVAQISDGLVALPAGPRTREQLEWLSEEVIDSGGTAIIWLATPGSRAQERQLAQIMAAARAAEYRALVAAAKAAAASPFRATALRRLRTDLRAIQRRDYFPPADRDEAEAAIQALSPGMPPTGADEGMRRAAGITKAPSP